MRAVGFGFFISLIFSFLINLIMSYPTQPVTFSSLGPSTCFRFAVPLQFC